MVQASPLAHAMIGDNQRGQLINADRESLGSQPTNQSQRSPRQLRHQFDLNQREISVPVPDPEVRHHVRSCLGRYPSYRSSPGLSYMSCMPQCAKRCRKRTFPPAIGVALTSIRPGGQLDQLSFFHRDFVRALRAVSINATDWHAQDRLSARYLTDGAGRSLTILPRTLLYTSWRGDRGSALLFCGLHRLEVGCWDQAFSSGVIHDLYPPRTIVLFHNVHDRTLWKREVLLAAMPRASRMQNPTSHRKLERRRRREVEDDVCRGIRLLRLCRDPVWGREGRRRRRRGARR